MGAAPPREKKYEEAKTTADFLGKSPEYGVFLVKVDFIDQKHPMNWPKEKQAWFEKSTQLILNLLGSTVLIVKPAKSYLGSFEFRIPFSKENFKTFQNPFNMEFDYNNYYTGYQWSIQVKNMEDVMLASKQDKAKIHLGKEEIPIVVNYVFIGKEMLHDLKRLNLEGMDVSKQINILVKAMNLPLEWIHSGKSWNNEHDATVRNFHLTNTQELLINGFLKHPYKEFENLYKLALEFYQEKLKNLKEVDEEELDLIDKDENRPRFPKNFEALCDISEDFFSRQVLNAAIQVYLIRPSKSIYHSATFYKKVVEMWFTSKDPYDNVYMKCYFKDPQRTKKILLEIYQTSWFFENVFSHCLVVKDRNSLYVLHFFMQNYPETREYLLSYKDKIDWKQIEGNPMEFLLKNYLFTPEFQMIPLKMIQFHGHVPKGGSPISNVLQVEGNFSSNKGESSNISIIAQEKNDKSFVVTHFFLRCMSRITYDSPVYTAVYFLPSEIPKVSSLEKFFGLTKEKFEQGEYPEDEVLKPVGFVDITKIHPNNYGEFKLKEPVIGKIFVCIFLSSRDITNNMDIDMTGCFGFVNQDVEKCKEVNTEGGGKRVLVSLVDQLL